MAYPGSLPTPQYNEGLAVSTPELREMYWVEDVATAQPSNRVIFEGLDPTIRTDQAEDGTAVVQAVVDEDGFPGLQAEIVLQGVWDVVLLDSFDDDICPGFSPHDPYSEKTPFFFGLSGSGSPRLLTKGHKDDDSFITGFLRPNPIAPGGLSASCLFRNIYLAVESWSGGWIRVTPVVNGEVLTDEAADFAIPYTDGGRTLRRFEIPLTREYDDGTGVVSRAGVVGTWFTCEIEVIDAFGCGRIEIAGLEIDGNVLAYEDMGLSFTGETMPDPTRSPSVTFFMGGEGPGILRGGQGIQDDGVDIEPLLQSNDVAPAGVGGECLFYEVHLAVTRNNANPWTITVTPIVDGIDQVPVEIEYAGVGAVVTEHQHITLAQPYIVGGEEVSLYHPRGAWFGLRIEADDAPDGTFTFEGFDLEGEVVTESLGDVFNA